MWLIQLCCLVAAAAAFQNYEFGNDYNNYNNYAPAPQQFAPAPQQYAPQQYAPAPQQYAPAPQQYAPAPQQFAPAPQQYAPAPQQYAPAPQQYARAPQQYRRPSNQRKPQGFHQNGRSAQSNNYQDYDYGNYGQPVMRQSGRSSGHQHGGYKPATKYVPVVVKKKSKKKTKIISVQTGFYIPGGTQMFGKFGDLHSCQKACELTPTCFAGDFNPWVKKCFMHNNLTACSAMKTHQQITHFKKVPCTATDTPRGLVTLGTQIFKGIEMKGIKSLTECIKKCTTMGGGIAPTQTDASVASTPQICMGIDYDFATHKCYIHTDATLCTNVASILTPKQLVQKSSSVNILFCALTMSGK